MKQGDTCLIGKGKFAGYYCKIVLQRTNGFTSIWADRIESYVNVSIPIILIDNQGNAIDHLIYTSLPVYYLTQAEKEHKIRTLDISQLGELFGIDLDGIEIPRIVKPKSTNKRISNMSASEILAMFK